MKCLGGEDYSLALKADNATLRIPTTNLRSHLGGETREWQSSSDAASSDKRATAQSGIAPGAVFCQHYLRLMAGVLAQLVERLVRNEKVRGSNPLGSTSLRLERSGKRRLPRRSEAKAGQALLPLVTALKLRLGEPVF